MSNEIELTIREVLPSDAKQLSKVMEQIGSETEFIIMDEHGLGLSVRHLAKELEWLRESNNNLLLVALDGDQIIGVSNVRADREERTEHIGEIGICLLKEYWHLGIGTYLLEETLLWAENSEVIRRLELRVQVRNERAVRLYKKMGFCVEAILQRGAKINDGVFVDVYLMSRMIN